MTKPREVSHDISEIIERLSEELTSIQHDPSTTLGQPESRLNNVILRFNALGGSFVDRREEREDEIAHGTVFASFPVLCGIHQSGPNEPKQLKHPGQSNVRTRFRKNRSWNYQSAMLSRLWIQEL